MSGLTLHHGDNLATLQALADQGVRFDLVELDGPYGAGLEAWDCLTPDEYLAHYTERLTLVRRVLQPWGVVFVFGYPEGCAEIKTWARQSNTLHLRRWLTWYKQRTAHKARKCEAILMLTQPPADQLWEEFKGWLKAERLRMGLKIVDACRLTGINTQHLAKVGGYLWFENDSATVPSAHDFLRLKTVFNIPAYFDQLCTLGSYEGLTDVDIIMTSYPEDTRSLNSEGLRSKPIGLYHDLFRPVVPPTPERSALVLYGGSGNAAIAAGQLGYTVTACETDAARCEAIRRAWAARVERRDVTPHAEYGPLFAGLSVA